MGVVDLATHTELVFVGLLARGQGCVHGVAGVCAVPQWSLLTYKSTNCLRISKP